MVAMMGKESKQRTCFTSPKFSSQPTPGKLKRHLGNKHRLLKHPPITLDYLSPFLHLCSQTLIVCADIHRNSQNSISVNMNNNNEDLDSTAACFRFFLSHLSYHKFGCTIVQQMNGRRHKKLVKFRKISLTGGPPLPPRYI